MIRFSNNNKMIYFIINQFFFVTFNIVAFYFCDIY